MTPLPRFRKLRRTATAVSGVVLLAVLAGGVVAAEEWPRPAQADVVARDIEVAAGEVSMVCPGPPRLATAATGDDLGYDEFDPEGSGTHARLDVISLGGEADPAGETRVGTGFDDGSPVPARQGHRFGDLSPLTDFAVLRAAPTGEMSAMAAGTTTALTVDGDLRGLAAARCVMPDTAAVFVAGSTGTGESAQLVLTNPGATAATVSLDAWGATGVIDTSALGSVLVAPRSQRVILLEAAAPDQERLAVQLRATGGEVAAHVQTSHLDGLTPAGTDLLSPGAAPARSQVLPGLVLGEATGDDSVLRLFNPGQAEAQVSVTLLGDPDVVAVPGAEDITIDPGTVIDISLAGLPAGEWGLQVAATEPVAAGALLLAAEDAAGVDRMWVGAAPALVSSSYAVPQDVVAEAALFLTNAGNQAEPVVVQVHDTTGVTTVELEVPAQGTHVVDLTAVADGDAAAWAIDIAAEGAGIHSGLVLRAEDGALHTWLAPTPDPHEERAVELAVRAPGLG